MAFLVSPGVQVKETDLTNIIPAVATSTGGFVGRFKWGPADEVTTVSGEQNLIDQFGYPKTSTRGASNTRTDWYTAANFLAYSNNLQLVRVVAASARNASARDSELPVDSDAVIKNDLDFTPSSLIGNAYARFPGDLGNSIGIAFIDAAISDSEFNGTSIFGGNTAADLFDARPGTSVWGAAYDSDLLDEVHVVVYTTDELATGTANQVLETYPFLSKAKNAKTSDSGPAYFVDVVNNNSQWVRLVNNFATATYSRDSDSVPGTKSLDSDTDDYAFGISLSTVARQKFQSFAAADGLKKYSLAGGLDGDSDSVDLTDGDLTGGYDLLGDAELVDVNLLLTGDHSTTVKKYAITKAEARKDAIAFISPDSASAVTTPTAAKVVNYFSTFNSTSYAVFDSGFKRQYDRYNDEFFNIPLSSDTAGVTARTEFLNDAWYSPAGLNRGFIQNVVKLTFNPDQTARDTLYKSRVNPIVTFRGQGTLLFGDKTALSKPSAFDRINVRRLFIVLEKAISTAAKFQLFEFNDDFTRANFVAAVEPFLGDVKSRRGMTDFKVVCDTTNNTPAVIDGNRFVADIYIKPNRSINFITLNFIAVRTGVSFEEIAGA